MTREVNIRKLILALNGVEHANNHILILALKYGRRSSYKCSKTTMSRNVVQETDVCKSDVDDVGADHRPVVTPTLQSTHSAVIKGIIGETLHFAFHGHRRRCQYSVLRRALGIGGGQERRDETTPCKLVGSSVRSVASFRCICATSRCV